MVKKPAARKDRPLPVFPHPSAELLSRGLSMLGIAEDDSSDPRLGTIRGSNTLIPLIQSYIRELELFNSVFDLVGAAPGTEEGRCDLVVRHILDSLAPWKYIADLLRRPLEAADASAPPNLADVGSGAGFPGIPLAMLFPDVRVSLVERMSKRCAFLENCRAVLGLKNVEVLNAEVENAPAAAYQVVAFRAFRPLERPMLRSLLALVRAGGCLAAWKARKEKIREEMSQIEKDAEGWSVHPVAAPFLEHEERNLVVIPSRPSLNPLN
ncbi:16S rRNA (guanine(527)-N(7))-methyltransferase RsmG [Treponema zuelzerae]|uniref:Ribosomal RNA small subunit methyltransferase G n=1 Tax=Teretinema zuelzerae TaxID=156 RepID=A0AAE3EIR0_9SPIR|nr:16S rRNA (guanine(527)-N(7))-methyltransferase RsmG [Teretinema zuelzerae]MCD1655760.1 16S rRNA (guanine(527)-N(7))-methyltransferase RsmG [Teretinema zuelzerae]